MLGPVILALILLAVAYIYWKLTFWKRQLIPNDVASIYNRFLKPFHLADQEAYRKFGEVIGTYEGLRPTLMLCEPTLIKKVLVEEFHNFPNHRIFYHKDQIAGKNIVVLENEEWKRLRNILTPVFTSSKLRNMKPLFEECVTSLMSNLSNAIRKDEIVNMKQFLGAFSLDVISTTAFGTKIDSINEPSSAIVTNMQNFFGCNISLKSLIVLFFPSLMEWFNIYLFNYDVLVFLNKLAHDVIRERRRQQAAGLNARRDVIQLLLEANFDGQQLTTEEIADNIMLFMVAGMDTTAGELASIVYCLATNGDCQERLFAEIAEYAEKSKLKGFDYEELNRLEYLDAVIKESLRILPSVPRIERRSDKDCRLGKLFIPKDTVIVVPIYTLNHDPRFFHSPDTFNPGRFLDGNFDTEIAKQIFLPFASGPRSCIGMRYAYIEMKACIANLVLKFKFDVCHATKIPLDYYTGQPVMTAVDVTLKVTER